MIPKSEVDSVRELEAEARGIKAQIKAFELDNGIPELRARAKVLTEAADVLREGWAVGWTSVYELAVQGLIELPELPVGLRMVRRTMLTVFDENALPREALAPKQSLLKMGMGGVVATTVFGSSVLKNA